MEPKQLMEQVSPNGGGGLAGAARAGREHAQRVNSLLDQLGY